MTRAVVCHSFGPPEALAVETIDLPPPGQGQLRIEVRAAGLGFPDLLTVQGLYQLEPPRPFVPGSEIAGVVEGVGDGVEGFAVGDRVISSGLGAFAERCLVDARRTLALPPRVAFEHGATLALTFATALHALDDIGRLQPGQTLLVLGAAGGLGGAAVQIGRALGAWVVAAATGAAKLQLCRRLGADETVDLAAEDLRERVDALTDGRGVDVALDPVGGAAGEAALRCVAWRGRLLTAGFASGSSPRYDARHLLLRERSVHGVYLGDTIVADPQAHRARMRRLVAWCEDGTIEPTIADRVALEQVPQALLRLMRREVSGKLVVVPGGAGSAYTLIRAASGPEDYES